MLLPLVATFGGYHWWLPLVATFGGYLCLPPLEATFGGYLCNLSRGTGFFMHSISDEEKQEKEEKQLFLLVC